MVKINYSNFFVSLFWVPAYGALKTQHYNQSQHFIVPNIVSNTQKEIKIRTQSTSDLSYCHHQKPPWEKSNFNFWVNNANLARISFSLLSISLQRKTNPIQFFRPTTTMPHGWRCCPKNKKFFELFSLACQNTFTLLQPRCWKNCDTKYWVVKVPILASSSHQRTLFEDQKSLFSFSLITKRYSCQFNLETYIRSSARILLQRQCVIMSHWFTCIYHNVLTVGNRVCIMLI